MQRGLQIITGLVNKVFPDLAEGEADERTVVKVEYKLVVLVT